ncbi:MAG: uncharacterized protein A8A55_2124 [Amphiamblys sp. WSBS2006]|nr:MAG: uncharacterized protein A8A55_2124 [Amphiamblys sp. WSBS2006]
MVSGLLERLHPKCTTTTADNILLFSGTRHFLDISPHQQSWEQPIAGVLPEQSIPPPPEKHRQYSRGAEEMETIGGVSAAEHSCLLGGRCHLRALWKKTKKQEAVCGAS